MKQEQFSEVEFLRRVEEVTEQANRMDNALFSDVRDTARLIKKDKSDVNKRHFIRSVMAYVEGMTYRMKQITLCFANVLTGRCEAGDLALLSEVRYELDNSGNVVSKLNYPRGAENNIRFAFGVMAKAFAVPCRLADEEKGWQALGATIGVRNRLMHPKTAAELKVSEDELSHAFYTACWFKHNSHSLYSIAMEKVETEGQEAKELLSTLKEAGLEL